MRIEHVVLEVSQKKQQKENHILCEGLPKIENAAFCGGPRIHLVKGKVNAG